MLYTARERVRCEHVDLWRVMQLVISTLFMLSRRKEIGMTSFDVVPKLFHQVISLKSYLPGCKLGTAAPILEKLLVLG